MTLIEKDKTKCGYIGKCKGVLCVLLMNVIHLEAHLKVKLHGLILKRKTLKHFSIVLVWLHKM